MCYLSHVRFVPSPHQSMPSDAESISHWNRCEDRGGSGCEGSFDRFENVHDRKLFFLFFRRGVPRALIGYGYPTGNRFTGSYGNTHPIRGLILTRLTVFQDSRPRWLIYLCNPSSTSRERIAEFRTLPYFRIHSPFARLKQHLLPLSIELAFTGVMLKWGMDKT